MSFSAIWAAIKGAMFSAKALPYVGTAIVTWLVVAGGCTSMGSTVRRIAVNRATAKANRECSKRLRDCDCDGDGKKDGRWRFFRSASGDELDQPWYGALLGADMSPMPQDGPVGEMTDDSELEPEPLE